MGAIKEIIIDRFDGGKSEDVREQTSNSFAITKHFDIFSNPKKLTPHRAFEATTENKTFDIVQFLQANSNVFGLGTTSGAEVAKIFKLASNTPTASWAEDQDVEGAGAREESVFFHYKNYLYFWEGGARLTRHGDITGTATNATYQTITYADIAQPVHHPADDIAYFFSDNNVHKLDNTTWSTNTLVLPTNLIITSAVAYGNFLAIACREKSFGNSMVFLWDRDSSFTTVTDKLDWGQGNLVVLGVADGVLVGISNVGTSVVFGILPKIQIKVYTGNTVQLLKEIDVDSTTTGDFDYRANGLSQMRSNKLYFAVDPESSNPAASGVYTGIWVIGRKQLGSPLTITMEYKIDTDAISQDTDHINGFNFFEDYMFMAHTDDGSQEVTNDAATFGTAIYDSQIFTGKDSSQTKKLISVTVFTVSLPTAGQILLRYLKDEDIDGQSWSSTATTVFINTTDDSIRQTATRDSAGAVLPRFKEIQFRIESTGGAEITGLKFKYEEIDDDVTR